MRRLVMTTAAMAAVLCFVNDVHAFDIKNKFMITALGGLNIPVGDFADDDTSNASAGGASTGYGLGAAIEYGVTNEFLIGGRFTYNRLGVEQSAFGGAIASDHEFDAHWSVIEYFGVYGKYLMLPASQTRPYLSGGALLGIATLNVNTATGNWSISSDPSLGLSAAAGVQHKFAGRIGAGIECRFVYLFVNEDNSIVPFDSQSLTAGTSSPVGVRDPGGNSKYLLLDGFISYDF